MKAIVTVIGKDKVGIIAGISAELQELNINILDVNQTIMGSNFAMMMMVNLSEEENFEEIKNKLTKKGASLDVDVRIQREDIFNSMHTI
ncbi:ACT domain-containing protein [uncultured Clostridium sp.]|uniref:ACT domain-containing protein n=1 Tax=uncultured Clostridium sp. TaxID=59620 RepID=UPI002632D7E9|nr:ACT domain-containing protein [uncultured Clostridium sp.]